MTNSNQSNAPSDESKTGFWQKNWVKNSLTVAVFIVLYLAMRPFMQGDVIEGKAPIMQLTSINGEPIDLQQLSMQGQPVLVHFWATWCPICSVAHDDIESIAEDYAVINIASQSADDEQLMAYAAENNMNPALIVNDLDGQWMSTFGAKAVPADFIIDGQGNIRFVEVGFTTEIGLRLRLWLAGF
ncbi:redoxin domain-containing protein [Thiomicrorhabdus sediminis]|uniref:Redoxin domain-containing protein n=1 Tax=Thiomicrorhabdus sediminis TaxID=2580412 RepID=A0A4P9K8L1_9GAMM|nr:redoxin domain-containing protein [Thiomicrorhabdus sediminis]QCU90800.1 redoxin domain-containing protein [Thiomicrorhabdus sediminis]